MSGPLDPWLKSILVCPLTRTPLTYDEGAQELVSDAAGLAYPIRDGVPVMLVEEARRLEASDGSRHHMGEQHHNEPGGRIEGQPEA